MPETYTRTRLDTPLKTISIKAAIELKQAKKTISSKASKLWQKVPFHLKILNSNRFSKEIKHFILNEQAGS